jgi:hypothetical protein
MASFRASRCNVPKSPGFPRFAGEGVGGGKMGRSLMYTSSPRAIFLFFLAGIFFGIIFRGEILEVCDGEACEH